MCHFHRKSEYFKSNPSFLFYDNFINNMCNFDFVEICSKVGDCFPLTGKEVIPFVSMLYEVPFMISEADKKYFTENEFF